MTDSLYALKVLVLNDDQEEEFTDLYIKPSVIDGYYKYPSDEKLITLIIHGQPYLTIKDEYLLAYLNFETSEI